MNTSSQFYCLDCSQLKNVDEAQLVFSSGFYRVRIPLGLCRSCHKQAAEAKV